MTRVAPSLLALRVPVAVVYPQPTALINSPRSGAASSPCGTPLPLGVCVIFFFFFFLLLGGLGALNALLEDVEMREVPLRKGVLTGEGGFSKRALWCPPHNLSLVAQKTGCYPGKGEPGHAGRIARVQTRGSRRSCPSLLCTFPWARAATCRLADPARSVVTKGSMAFPPPQRHVSCSYSKNNML